MLKPVTSLGELAGLARTDPDYARLAQVASRNLGGPDAPLDAALQWLRTCAMETDEEELIEEVNFCRDMGG